MCQSEYTLSSVAALPWCVEEPLGKTLNLRWNGWPGWSICAVCVSTVSMNVYKGEWLSKLYECVNLCDRLSPLVLKKVNKFSLNKHSLHHWLSQIQQKVKSKQSSELAACLNLSVTLLRIFTKQPFFGGIFIPLCLSLRTCLFVFLFRKVESADDQSQFITSASGTAVPHLFSFSSALAVERNEITLW